MDSPLPVYIKAIQANLICATAEDPQRFEYEDGEDTEATFQDAVKRAHVANLKVARFKGGFAIWKP